MALKDRKTLKNLFKNGSMPTESSFEDIIDSGVNKIDDGFSKSMKEGLMLSPTGSSNALISFFKKLTDYAPQWSIALKDSKGNTNTEKRLNFVKQEIGEEEAPTVLSLGNDVGIHTEEPCYPLEVAGFVGMKGRVGTAMARDTAPADGNWHTIVDQLNHCTAFEVVARAGAYKTGVHAIVHAIATSAYGNSHHSIRHTQARFSFWRPLKIKLRWVGTTFNYSLQIATSKDLGPNTYIKYHVTQLWDDEEVGLPSHYMET